MGELCLWLIMPGCSHVGMLDCEPTYYERCKCQQDSQRAHPSCFPAQPVSDASVPNYPVMQHTPKRKKNKPQ